ncbi:MAG: MFS transporter [Clostridia bacterium]|nr:MFS transporter [Clostridia bacterium]
MKRLTKRQMRIFAVGQLGWSMLSGIISAWFVTFYLPTQADIEGGAQQYIVPGLVIGGFLTILGLITALSRVFDAVTDPLIASMSDRSKNKRGRRIPFMQLAAIPLSAVTVLLFCAPVEAISNTNIIWISVFIVLFYLFMTMYCTPYNALISEFGKTQDDRMYISTAISLTFFAGTMLAYTPFVFAGMLRESYGFAWSYRICFIVLAVVACICMLIPTFALKEKEFVDTKPSETNMFKSLGATFRNGSFRTFVGSDIMYWVGLTLFQTGLPFFVKVSMNIDESFTMYFLGGMTVLSACFYPVVSGLVKKFGKKKLVITGFLGLALAYVVATLIGILGTAENPGLLEMGSIPGVYFGIAICVIAAFPMALLGIIPQSIVADVAEADGIDTGENREGMFFAARTFAMKFGQSLAMLIFTSLAIIGTTQNKESNDITASVLGMTIVGIVAVVFCVLGAMILGFYNEKKVMATIDKKNSPTEEAPAETAEEAPVETAEEAPAETAEEAPVETAEEAPAETAEEAPVETAEEAPAETAEKPTVEEIEQEVMAITETPVEETPAVEQTDEEDSGMITKFPDDEEGE